MSVTMIETMEGLTLLMDEECVMLGGADGHARIAELAAAKQKLTARLESQIAFHDREQPRWREQLSPEMSHVIRRMQDAAARNARILRRQIELSQDLLEAIALEAQRLAGLRVDTYGDGGAVSRFNQPAPMTINARA